jgi:cell division transport system permease protein
MSLRAHARTAFAQAGTAVRAAPLLPLVATLALGFGMTLFGGVYIAARNVGEMLRTWGEGLQLTVYLEPGSAPARGAQVGEALRRVPGIEHVRFVTSAEAMQRLREGMGARSPLLDGVEEDLLPPSLEVTFERGKDDAKTVSAVAERVARMPGVGEVETMGDWVKRVQAAADLLRGGALLALILVGTACLYLVGATIRLAVFARREEIEILKLCGATHRYVRAPFWIEGALEGLIGGCLGAGALYLLYRTAAPRLEALLGGVLGGVHLHFVSLAHLAAGIGGLALIGLLGSHLAVRRHLHV